MLNPSKPTRWGDYLFTTAIWQKITDEQKMRECAVERVENGNFDILSSIPGKQVNEGINPVPHPRWGHKKVKIRHSREK